MKEINATFTSKGQLVIPADLRRKHGITAGTRVKLLEDRFGRIVLQPITEGYIDRVMGCLADGPDLVAKWKEQHRREGRREERKRKP
jgi:AbrB family looped-hinge helix DNA binding protein